MTKCQDDELDTVRTFDSDSQRPLVRKSVSLTVTWWEKASDWLWRDAEKASVWRWSDEREGCIEGDAMTWNVSLTLTRWLETSVWLLSLTNLSLQWLGQCQLISHTNESDSDRNDSDVSDTLSASECDGDVAGPTPSPPRLRISLTHNVSVSTVVWPWPHGAAITRATHRLINSTSRCFNDPHKSTSLLWGTKDVEHVQQTRIHTHTDRERDRGRGKVGGELGKHVEAGRALPKLNSFPNEVQSLWEIYVLCFFGVVLFFRPCQIENSFFPEIKKTNTWPIHTEDEMTWRQFFSHPPLSTSIYFSLE